MILNQRQYRLLDLLVVDEVTPVKRLTESLGVSAVTIRHDLNYLESEGFLKRVHGGAVLRDADDISNRMGINYEHKLRIATKASEYVDTGETVLIESGSINALLARQLVQKKVTKITPNIFIARQFRKNRDANIILLGGIYQHESESMVGKLAKAGIDHINFNKAFIGIDGFTQETGFTSRDLLRAEISSYIIEKSLNAFVLTDSTKFGKVELTNICQARDISHVITDKYLSERYLRYFKNSGVDLILA